MRIEWDAKTRERISTVFFISLLSSIALILLGVLNEILSISITGGLLRDFDDIILKLLMLMSFWTFYISFLFSAIVEIVKTRRMSNLKRMVKTAEVSETGKYVKSYVHPNLPPYILADSIDRLLLGAILEFGGDYLSVSTKLHRSALPGNPDQVNNILVKLYLLGLIDFDWDYEQIVLTSMGVDAAHIPVSLFMTKLPPHIWNEVLKMKRAIQSSDWKGAVISAARALEVAMKDKLHIAMLAPDVKSTRRLESFEIEEVSLAEGITELVQLKKVRENGLEYHLFQAIRYIRNPQVHYPKATKAPEEVEYEMEAASKCDIYISLLFRAWYGNVD
ncbi:MAG: hypothetical protein ACTSWA_10620 [Candidatus Thorarchaeota archaeon]